jgi:hypothetical protein
VREADSPRVLVRKGSTGAPVLVSRRNIGLIARQRRTLSSTRATPLEADEDRHQVERAPYPAPVPSVHQQAATTAA